MYRLLLFTLLIACAAEQDTEHQPSSKARYDGIKLEPSTPTKRDIFSYAAAPAKLKGWELLGVYGDGTRLYSALLKAPNNTLYTPSLNNNPRIDAGFTLIEIGSTSVIVKKHDATYRIDLPVN